MKLTLKYAEEELAEYVDGGSCKENVLRKRINEAVRTLLRMGDYASIDRFCLWTCNSCITLPPDVKAVRKINIEGVQAQIHTEWFEFLEGAGVQDCCDWACEGMTHRGDDHPTFADLPFPMYLLAVSDMDEDEGSQIFASGTDQHGQPVRSVVEGDIRFGESIDISNMDCKKFTSNLYSTVTLVEKPQTKGIVRLYGYIPEQDARCQGLPSNVFMIGYYLPWETRPCYTRIEITGLPKPNGTKVTILAKRKWIPLVHPDQILPISNLDALSDILMARTAKKNKDRTAKRQHEADAKTSMGEEQEDTRGSENETDVAYFTPEAIV